MGGAASLGARNERRAGQRRRRAVRGRRPQLTVGRCNSTSCKRDAGGDHDCRPVRQNTSLRCALPLGHRKQKLREQRLFTTTFAGPGPSNCVNPTAVNAENGGVALARVVDPFYPSFYTSARPATTTTGAGPAPSAEACAIACLIESPRRLGQPNTRLARPSINSRSTEDVYIIAGPA